MTAIERETWLQSKLTAHGYNPERIQSEGSDAYGWWLRVDVGNRTFTFGSEIRDGFSFSEIKDDQYISYMRHIAEPIRKKEESALTESVDMIIYCLKNPGFKGLDQPVI